MTSSPSPSQPELDQPHQSRIDVALAPVEILSSADGEPVALHDFGGSGQALLLGHGNGLNAGMWAAAVPHLRRLGFHCHGVDLRGHGACRPVSPDYEVGKDRFAEDILACVDALGGGPVAFAGHSLGAAAGILAALRRPEAFLALWAFEPVLVPAGSIRPSGSEGNSATSRLAEASRKRRMEFDSVDAAMARLGSKPPFSACDPLAVRGYLEIGTTPVPGGVRLTCRGEDEARVFATAETLDFGLLAGLEVPTTVVRGASGGEAHAVPATLAPVVAEAIGRARLETHDAMSHFGPMEDGETIARSIARAVTPAH